MPLNSSLTRCPDRSCSTHSGKKGRWLSGPLLSSFSTLSCKERDPLIQPSLYYVGLRWDRPLCAAGFLFRVIYAHIYQLTAGSRQIFAFSRDGGFPFSGWLYHINPRVHAPVRCVWVAAIIALLLGLLSFAGPNAIGAIFSLSVISQYACWSIPIMARHIGGQKISLGPFHLGIFVSVYTI